MQYRRLGRDGPEVSVVAFGCGGNARLMVGDDDELQRLTVLRAVERGVNCFDTAAAYGDGRSERNLGQIVRGLDAGLVVCTKVVLEQEDLDDPGEAVRVRFEESLRRLGMPAVHGLFLHNRVYSRPETQRFGVGAPLSLEHVLGPHGVAAAFDRAVRAKQASIAGFTAYGGDPAAIVALIDSGAFGVINASINMANPSAVVRVSEGFEDADYGAVAAYAARAGLGVMAIQVLARGALTGDGPETGRLGEVAAAARAYDGSLPSAALRYVLSKPEVSTAVLGLSEPAHVEEAVAAIERGGMGEAAVRAIEGVATGL